MYILPITGLGVFVYGLVGGGMLVFGVITRFVSRNRNK